MQVPRPRRWLPPGLALLGAMLGLAASAPAANIALNKPAFASVVNDTAGNVTDNNFSTEWNTNNDIAAPNHFVGVDLGAGATPKFARLYWPANQPHGFTIDVANTVQLTDPTAFDYGFGDWQTVYTRTSSDEQPGSPDLIPLDLPAGQTTFRYIRIQGTEGPSVDNGQWGVIEFQVLNAPLPNLTGVTKTNSGPVANAIVQVTGPTGGQVVSMSALSNEQGQYTIVGLDPGQYTVRGLAPGQYAPVSTTVNVGETNVTQDITFTTPAINSTAPLPAYALDFVASEGNAGNQNAQTNGNALPVDELPAGNQIWTTNTALPGDGTIGENLPPTLKFFFPPTADGQNNVINAANAVIPFPAAHYTAVYLLQVAGDQPAYLNATINYTDGSSEPVVTGSGNALYAFHLGTGSATEGGAPGEDEVTAFTVSKMVNTGGTVAQPFSVFMRGIPVNPAKVLKNITFGDYVPGPGSGTFSRGFILGYSADSTDTPAALGSIAGHVKFGANPVEGALVRFLSYRATTDATGAYKFNSVPAGTWQVSAAKAANFPTTTIDVNVAAGQNVTNADIVFANAIPVVTEFLSNPIMDVVSTDANLRDNTPTNFMLGREYIPTGLYSPATVPNPPADPVYKNKPPWEASTATGVPTALKFQFGDIQDTPILVGDPGYPEGGTPNAAILQGSTFLAPQGSTIYNAYFVEIGAEGATTMEAILRYTDGTTDSKVVSISDWFGTNTPDELPYLVMHGRHEIGNGGESNQGDNVKMNVLTIPVNPNKTLRDIVFPQGPEPNKYPIVLAVSWEVDHLPPAASDVEITVKTSGGAPANRAVVSVGPYNARTDANGVATFRGLPAGVALDITAYLSGQTKAAVQKGYIVPTGQKPAKLTLTLPASAPIFVQLSPAFDYDVISTLEMPGDYKGAPNNDRAFKAEELAAPGANIVVNGVPYVMPNTAVGYSNVMRANGQKINVAPGHYSSVNVVSTGMGNGPTKVWAATLTYDDGTSELVQYGSMDWVMDWANPNVTNRRLFFRQVAPTAELISPGRRSGDNDDTAQAAFVPQMIPVNANKVLTSIQFPRIMRDVTDDDFSILAITLEANDTDATGTITGSVTGQVAGATSSGPIARAMVMWDAGHAAYTDATGNFTIRNVPLGSGNLTVIPEGSGILTKSFPVTVTATTNVGALNVGAAVNKVSVDLGATNNSTGLRQVEGYAALSFGKDGNRPDFHYTRPESGTRPVNIAGQAGREMVDGNGTMYFQVDNGWLNRGWMGTIGLDPATFTGDVTGNGTFAGKLAPQLYLKITYLDRGTDDWRVNLNRMEGWVWDNSTIASMRMTFRNYTPRQWNTTTNAGEDIVVKKTNTNTWKSIVINLNPTPDANGIQNAFGAYAGLALESDFTINGQGGQPEVISEVVISTSPNFTVPPGPYTDAIQIAGGLKAATPADVTALDVTGPAGTKDGKVTILDALTLLRQAQ